MIKKCKWCCNEFNGVTQRKFCSPICSSRYYEKYIRIKIVKVIQPKECEWCKNIFIPSKNHPATKFCSQKCRQTNYSRRNGIGLMITKKCLYCNKKITVNKKVKYCSSRCKTKYWYKVNPDRKLWSEYRNKHPKKRKKWDRDYRLRNPLKVKLRKLKRRERKKKMIHNYTRKEWLQKLKDTFGVCPKCNKYVSIIKLTLDHIIPISKAKVGQVYTINDVQPLCLSCNCKKNNKIVATL